jgi:diguanylate cyclase (GGDEF)-like protein
MRSIHFGQAVIAMCGVAAFAAGIQVTLWEHEVRTLTDAQGVISAQLGQLRNVIRAVLDSETGQRGYLLTGENEYLKPYESGRANCERALAQLTDLVREEPAIQKAVTEIAKITRAKEAELARTVELRRSGDAAAALAIVKSGEGLHLMEVFTDRSSALLTQLRAARGELAAAVARKFDATLVLGGLVVVLIIVLVATAVRWLSITLCRVEALQMQREQEAMHDALTGLPNRRYLGEWFAMTRAGARRSGGSMAVLYFDLDGFKQVNDRFGHDAGDSVLQATAARLRGAVRTSDFVARLGGDEFVAVLPHVAADAELSTLLDRLDADLARAALPDLVDGEVSASVGVAHFPGDGDDLDALLAAADRSMYELKQQKKSAKGRLPRSQLSAAEPAAAADG